MNTYLITCCSFSLIVYISSAGDPPGIVSTKKCYEYRNIKDEIPSSYYHVQTEEDIKLIQLKEEALETAIAGGYNATSKQLPFMAALGYEVDNKKEYLCGGTLISEEFVLTAAHCISTRKWGQVKYVRLGDLNLGTASDDDAVQEITIEKHHIHPNYSYPKRYHDIALVKLSKPVVLTDYVSPACLEFKRKYLGNIRFYAAGWGALGYEEEPSDHLQVAELQHYPVSICQPLFNKKATIPLGILAPLQICAGGITHIADTCKGDSGGPLVYRVKYPNDIYYLAGITSFGIACALGMIPAIYTRVSSYTDWIERTVWPEHFTK